MKSKICSIILVVGLLFASQQTNAQEIKKGMIKVTILYPAGEGKTFNMDYYATKHMPLVAQLMGDSLKTFTIDKGISGRAPNDPATYVAIGYLYFETISAYQNSMQQNRDKILKDIPNYTNIQPVIQVSEVIK
jgi:uncharacterized protein (TIGR02118 family)